ncbi:MAG: DegT/DnrJ/EryC1/StrS family aminotransferase [Candidatus Thorarchaeota archaeon]|nr:DegT/DnrJ/EryC1/StrS family aminotransferase [Candidatus Thorarchaeota archaeon]
MTDNTDRIMVSDLSYDDQEIEAVLEVLKSEWLTMGPKTIKFEEMLSSFIGSKHVVATSNGTASLHLSLLSLGIGPGDEVIVTPLSFVASANSILYTGAKPVFVDVDPNTFNIDPTLIESSISDRTKAILPVHLAGLPAEMDEINRIAKDNEIRVIDDAAHAIGAKYKNQSIGTLADATGYSFFSNKNLSVGEGGAISTNNSETAAKLRLLRSHGLTKSTWSRHHDKEEESKDQLYDMIELGYNYRITEINAALGIVQLAKLANFNEQRKAIYELYKDLLSNLNVALQEIPQYVHHSHHVLPVLVQKGTRSKVRQSMENAGIGTSIHYTPIHKFTYYQEHGYSDVYCPFAEDIGNRVVTLPLHQKLTEKDVHYIVSKLKSILAE